jgi:hypothetical protein
MTLLTIVRTPGDENTGENLASAVADFVVDHFLIGL